MNQIQPPGAPVAPSLYSIASPRLPPHNLDMEQAVLGAILCNNNVFHRFSQLLRPEHFADAVHGRIYAAAATRIIEDRVADFVTLIDDFASRNEIEEIGGAHYLLSLEKVARTEASREYAVAIHDLWRRRETIAVAERLIEQAHDRQVELAASSLSAIAQIDRTLAGADRGRGLLEFDGVMDAVIDQAEAASRGEGGNTLKIGMPTVDDAIGGLESGTMTLLAGRPGSGKSAIGWQWAAHVARVARDRRAAGASTADIPGVAGISLEMPREAVGRRFLSALSGIPASVIKRGDMRQCDFDRLVQCRREASGLPLTIEDSAGLTLQQIRAKIRAIKRRHGLGLIVIDHLHIVRPEVSEARNGGSYAVEQISLGMVALAKEFEVPLLCLAQLNRQLESRDDKRPTRADLRQSGALEQDANTILFVHRPEMYLGKAPPERTAGEKDDKYADRVKAWEDQRERLKGRAELILEKVRDGDTRVVPLRFHGPTMTFSEVDSVENGESR